MNIQDMRTIFTGSYEGTLKKEFDRRRVEKLQQKRQ